MYTVILTDNIKGEKTLKANCSKRQFTKLKKVEYLGGFKRFDIELYDINGSLINEFSKIIDFLAGYAFLEVTKENVKNLFN